MLRSIVIPQWVLGALKEKHAPLETVLDPFALSSILSPLDVGFYFASVDIIFGNMSGDSAKTGTVSTYDKLFEAIRPVHYAMYDMIEDALEAPALCDDRKARLRVLLDEYNASMRSLTETLNNRDNGDFSARLCATLWRDSGVAFSDRISSRHPKEVDLSYVPKLDVVPFTIGDDNTMLCTRLRNDHFDRTAPSDNTIVMGVTFRPVGELDTQQDAAMESYSAAMSKLANFTPLNAVMGSELLTGYMREKQKIR